LKPPDYHLEVPDYRLEPLDDSLEVPDYRLEPPDYCLEASDYSLKDPDYSLTMPDSPLEPPEGGQKIPKISKKGAKNMVHSDWIPTREQDLVDLCGKWAAALAVSANVTALWVGLGRIYGGFGHNQRLPRRPNRLRSR
jgi:hypothetical protein